MAEEIKENEKEIGGVDYVKIIENMKKTTVPIEEYEKLAEAHKEAISAIVDGTQVSAETPETAVDIDKEIQDLRSELYGGNYEGTNLDYWEKTLQLRDRIIESGKKDPFLPVGEQITPDANDIEQANKLATVVKECIEYAEGDSQAFTNELQRRTIDKMPMVKLD